MQRYQPMWGKYCRRCGRKLIYREIVDNVFDSDTGMRVTHDVFICPSNGWFRAIVEWLTGTVVSHTIVPATLVDVETTEKVTT